VDVSKANLRWQEQMLMIQSPEVEISSTEIRKRLEENRSIRYMVPQQVEAYIQKNRLYTKE